MTLYQVARFYPDNQSDTNQWPIDPSSKVASHGGAGYQIALGPAEVGLIKRINPGNAEHSAQDVWKWACHDDVGFLYIGNWESDSWLWPMVIMGSGAIKINVVNVLASERGKRRIETIPVLPNYDHLSPQTHPWLFHRVIVTNRTGDWDSPVGIFYMPLFSAFGREHPKGELTGAWVRSGYIGSLVTEPPVEPPTEPPPATGKTVVAIRRTVYRQRPHPKSPSMGAYLLADQRAEVYEFSNGWAHNARGWLNPNDIIVL